MGKINSLNKPKERKNRNIVAMCSSQWFLLVTVHEYEYNSYSIIREQ